MSLVSVVFCPQHSSFREPKPNACDAVLPTNSSCGQELWLDISQNAPLNMGRWGNRLEHASGAYNIAALTLKLYEAMKQSKMNSAVKCQVKQNMWQWLWQETTLYWQDTQTHDFYAENIAMPPCPWTAWRKKRWELIDTWWNEYAAVCQYIQKAENPIKDSFPVVWAVCSSVTTYDVLSSETSRFACRSSWRRNLSPTVKSVQIELHGLGAECRALFFH